MGLPAHLTPLLASYTTPLAQQARHLPSYCVPLLALPLMLAHWSAVLRWQAVVWFGLAGWQRQKEALAVVVLGWVEGVQLVVGGCCMDDVWGAE